MKYFLTYESSYSSKTKIYTCKRSVWENKSRFAYFDFTTDLDPRNHTDLAQWKMPDGSTGYCGLSTSLDRHTLGDQARILLVNSSIGYLKQFSLYIANNPNRYPSLERWRDDGLVSYKDDLQIQEMTIDEPEIHNAFQELINEYQQSLGNT